MSAATMPSLKRRSRLPEIISAVATPVISGVLGIGAWELIVRLMALPPYLLPAPSLIVQVMIDKWALLWGQLGYTALAAAVGFAIAMVLGLVAGAGIAASRVVDRMLYPWLVVFHAIPKVVVAPLLLVWVGFGMKSGIIFVVIFTFFPILVNTVTGLKSADPDLLQLTRSMKASTWKMLWKIRMPSALPSIMSGVKISATMAPLGAVIGEFVASNKGLGHLLIQAVGSLEVPLAFAAVVMISIFGILVWYAADLIERKVIPWHASQRVPTP